MVVVHACIKKEAGFDKLLLYIDNQHSRTSDKQKQYQIESDSDEKARYQDLHHCQLLKHIKAIYFPSQLSHDHQER